MTAETEMTISNAQYISDPITDRVTTIRATIDGQERFIPLDERNVHYAEILRQVEAGTLVIQEAD